MLQSVALHKNENNPPDFRGFLKQIRLNYEQLAHLLSPRVQTLSANIISSYHGDTNKNKAALVDRLESGLADGPLGVLLASTVVSFTHG